MNCIFHARFQRTLFIGISCASSVVIANRYVCCQGKSSAGYLEQAFFTLRS